MSTAWSHFRLTEKFLKDIPVADSSTVVETLPNGIVGFLLSGVQGNTLTAPPAATEIAKTGSVWLSAVRIAADPQTPPLICAPNVIGPVFTSSNAKSSISTVLGHLQLPKLRVIWKGNRCLELRIRYPTPSTLVRKTCLGSRGSPGPRLLSQAALIVPLHLI